MSEIVEFYTQQAKQGLSSLPWLADIQTKALNQLNRRGFPSRHDEEWKYTSVDALLKQSFHQPLITEQNQPVKSDLPVKHQVQFKNGVVLGLEALTKSLPAGVLILPLQQALQQHEQLIKPYLNNILTQEHGFHALNTALIQCGLFVYIPAGIRIDETIAVIHYQDQMNQAVHYRHVIVAEAESEISLLEEYQGLADCNYFTNVVTEVHAAAGAKVSHYKIQRESKAAYHLGQVSVKSSAHSEFSGHSFSFGGKLTRSDTVIYLQQEHAKCLMNAIYAPTEGQHVDHHTTVHHLVPNCRSEQDYKGILGGRSRAVFNGKVIVAKDAQHTDAQQQNKNLLLSAHAEIDTKPQLEIFADDVLCSHGATVGQLDEDALFYLATRGICRQDASNYLIHAFAIDNLRLIANKELSDWLSHLIAIQVG